MLSIEKTFEHYFLTVIFELNLLFERFFYVNIYNSVRGTFQLQMQNKV